MAQKKAYRVLIVEDDKWSRELIAEWVSMREELHLVARAENGAQALDIIQTEKARGADAIDLILLDIQMPGMTGLEFLERIEEPPFVIFTTAHEGYAARAFDVGAVDYLLKPITRERFDRAIDRFIKTVKQNIPYDVFETIENLKGDEKYRKSSLSDEVANTQSAAIRDFMESRRAYLDDEMTLNSMARELSIPPYHISQVLNTKMNTRFYHFVNSYRVEEAKRLLASAAHEARSILEISQMAGFKSKSVFNSVFKEFTGLTPKEFREEKGRG